MQREGCYFEAYRLTANRNPSSNSPEPMASAPAKAGYTPGKDSRRIVTELLRQPAPHLRGRYL
jgi:hypothetical protein